MDAFASERGSEDYVRVILSYLIDHPEAKDALDGIMTFWINQQDMLAKKQVQKALDHLVEKGWVLDRITSTEERFYGIRKEALSDITVFLGRTSHQT